MRFRSPSRMILLAVLALAACDRTPTDPALLDVDAALKETAESAVFAAAPTSLHHLFGKAVARVARSGNRAAFRDALSKWRHLNEQARSALTSAERPVAHEKVAAVRSAELEFVVRTLGNAAVAKVASDVGLGLAQVRLQIAAEEQTGTDITRAQSMAGDVSALLHRANQAIEAGDYISVLDYATQASDQLDAVAHFLIDLHRIPTLETFVAEARHTYGRERGATALAELQSDLKRLNDEARTALRAGDRTLAAELLDDVRTEQIRMVLNVLGADVVESLIEQVEAGVGANRKRVATIPDAQLHLRVNKMLAEATSLNRRARAAWAAQDPAAALDLASHSAGLVNAVRHLIPVR